MTTARIVLFEAPKRDAVVKKDTMAQERPKSADTGDAHVYNTILKKLYFYLSELFWNPLLHGRREGTQPDEPGAPTAPA